MVEYVTIKEFCKLAKISPQSIYKKLKKTDNQLNNFIKLVDNKKMISLEALKLYQKEETKQEQSNPEPESATENGVNKDLIELLRKELEAKNQQIADLNERLKQEQDTHKQLLNQEQELNLRLQKKLDVLQEENVLLLESKATEAEEEKVKKPWWKFF